MKFSIFATSVMKLASKIVLLLLIALTVSEGSLHVFSQLQQGSVASSKKSRAHQRIRYCSFDAAEEEQKPIPGHKLWQSVLSVFTELYRHNIAYKKCIELPNENALPQYATHSYIFHQTFLI